jgi:peptide/nickel transport system ATP-binding protein
MVFQDPLGSLHPRHSINNILKEPLEIHNFSDIENSIKQVLNKVGLDSSFRFRCPHQIWSLAYFTVRRTNIRLDVSVQAEILNLLMDLQESVNLTYLRVSNDLGVVGHMCKRISVMNKGE